MENYYIALAVFIALFAFSRIADKILRVKEDREFKEYVDRIVNPENDELPTQEQIFLEMETVKEAIIDAYEMEDESKAKVLGAYLNQLRAIKYHIS
jgi:hypothetical protein